MAFQLLSNLPNDTGLAIDLDTNTLARWDGKQFVPVRQQNVPITVTTVPILNATFTGEIRIISKEHAANLTDVVFSMHAEQIAVGTPAQEFTILSPVQLPLLGRFIGTVDEFARGYNSNTNRFDDLPIRISADEGLVIVTPPNIAVGTRWSIRFDVSLVEEV